MGDSFKELFGDVGQPKSVVNGDASISGTVAVKDLFGKSVADVLTEKEQPYMPEGIEHALRGEKEIITFEQGKGGINISSTLSKASELLRKQSLTDVADEDVTIKSIEVNNAKVNSFVSSLDNMVDVSHLVEIISGDKEKFRRAEELAALNPLLRSYKDAAVRAEKQVTYWADRLEILQLRLDNMPQPTEDMSAEDLTEMAKSEAAVISMANETSDYYDKALDNLNRIATGLAKVIKVERDSGGRDWGKRSNKNMSTGYINDLDAYLEEKAMTAKNTMAQREISTYEERKYGVLKNDYKIAEVKRSRAVNLDSASVKPDTSVTRPEVTEPEIEYGVESEDSGDLDYLGFGDERGEGQED